MSKTTALDEYEPDLLSKQPGERWVTMTNALTRASHGLTLSEKRLVILGISKIDSRKSHLPQSERARVTATEYSEAFDVTHDVAYQQLQAAGKHLIKRQISFYEPAFKRGKKQIDNTLVEMNWVQSVRYQAGEGWIELNWVTDLLPHLTGLKKQFTSYQLSQASALRSVASWKLLELLMRFKANGWAQYTIEDFCASMGATQKQREDFAKIRTKLIEPAIRELTEKYSWKIEWKPVKAGRKVIALRFDFAPSQQQPLDFEGDSQEAT